MARLVVLLLIIAYGSGMKMRETVERTVMVRTTGSDLQPAATGFIYKRGTNGEAVVTKLGESEVMEQLSKFYNPKEFRGEENAPVKSEEKVIPVKEENDDVDGIADEDYKKAIDEYSSSFDDYIKSLGDFKDYNNKDFNYNDYFNKNVKDGDKHNDYDNKKFESYYMAREEIPFKDAYGKNYNHEEYNNDYHSYKVPQGVGFRYKQNEKDNADFVRDEHRHDGGKTGNVEHEQSSEHEGLGNEKKSDEHGTTNSDEDSTTNGYIDFGAKIGPSARKSYAYDVKH